MDGSSVVVSLSKGRRVAKVEGLRVTFSPHRCFAFDDGKADVECLSALGAHIKSQPGLAFYGTGPFLEYLLKHVPELRTHAVCVIPSQPLASMTAEKLHGMPVATLDNLPAAVRTVFLCETLIVPRLQMRGRMPAGIKVLDPAILAEIASHSVPDRAWTPVVKNIYPIDLPEIKFEKGLDLILIDCPSRNLALMPNGLAYVNNALKNTEVTYQIFDLDIVAYHRFHMHRLFDAGGRVTLPSGRVMPEDPWQAEHYDVWTSASEMSTTRHGHTDVIDFFRPLIDETVDALVAANPKILGLSIQQCNEAISQQIVRGVKAKRPDIVVVVGGFSCYNADIGRRVFPDSDYMCVGEADLTVGPLVEALARGERPANQAGILSRFDTPNYRFIPAPMAHDLDQIEFPKYQWCDLSLYRNYNDYQLTPIIASRGCRWSRCTFCAERFYWRIRSPQNFADELDWLVQRGCYLFMFNESDLGGMPERVMEICDEIVRRGLHRKVKLTGQLRVNKKQNRLFFEKLREANFVALRFGVDAFSANTLRLQKKGYTVEMLSQNLKDCWESGIYTEVNWVIGVPGETDADVDEGIELILKNRQYIGRLANINPLILVNGGVYWIDPDAHHIKFRAPKEELYAKYPRAIPADFWYSVDPYIDGQVRKARFEKIVLALHEAGFPVGAWAAKIIEDVKLARDPNRASGAKTSFALASPDEEAVAPTAEGAGAKPAATPPLFRVAGEAPRLVRRTESHDVVVFNGWYYGVPRSAAGGELLATDPSQLAGTIKHLTEDAVLAEIDDASDWANSRGQYDAQNKQRAGESYMRADSVLAVGSSPELPTRAKILCYKPGEFIAVGQEALDSAFDLKPFSWLERTSEPPPLDARSPLRRVAAKLPPALQHELRRIVRVQSYKEGDASGKLITRSDKNVLGVLLRGAVDSYVKRPVTRLLKNGERRGLAVANPGVNVAGEDFSIVSVVTKNTVPELMWSLDGHNIVKYDGMFYGLPHGMAVDWDNDDVPSMPNVILAQTVKEVVDRIESRTLTVHAQPAASANNQRATGPAGEASQVPILLATVEKYNIVTYEGWVYGIPHVLGPLDLTEVDLIGMPGVIRDVSRDVVESEILDRVKFAETAAS